ncbi:MAG: ABC transporter substrate-binding protein [Trueperaceae bacterium]
MKRFLTALVALALVATAAAQTLVVGQSGLPVTLDTGQDGNSLTPAIQIVERLVGFEQGSAQIEPLLATSWEPNEDSTVWTFHLRDGVSFHDGTAFNAEAVKFNFDRWNLRDHEFNFVEQGRDFTSFTYVFGGYHGDPGYQIERVDVIDDLTVQFTLTGSIGFFPQQLASAYFGLHSPSAVAAGGIEYGTPTVGAVGTGPFVFGEWIDGDRVVLVRNDTYWGQVAGVEQIVFRGIDSPTARLAELEAGSIDIALNLSPESYDIVASSTQFRPVSAESDLVIGYLGMHQANAPFDDLRVRQAFAYAIDSEAIIDAFYGNLAQVANEFVPPGLFGRLNQDPYPYDPERARELLAEAGYPNGFDTEYWYMPVSRPYFPAPRDVAEAVVSYLADVGIRASLHTEDWGIYLENYSEGKFPIYMLGWSADFADPDNFISSFFNEANAVGFGYDNPTLFALISDAQQAGSLEERDSLYQQIAQILHDDLPALPFVNPRTLNGVWNNIEGFYPNALGSTVPFNTITKN